jgi:formylglycine-generating enzyme required for sulfatase activity
VLPQGWCYSLKVRLDCLAASAILWGAGCSAIATFDGRPEHLTNAADDGGGADDGASVISENSNDCPGTAGPPAVRVGTFCVDSTEVTNDHYAAFLAAKPSGMGLPDACDGKRSFEPTGWPLPSDKDAFAVVEVDWCDAFAYCQWAGKRLCGAIGGGTNAAGASADPTQSQWFNACSRDATRTYPYGADYQAGACNGDGVRSGVATVRSFAGCVGGWPGIFDMSGNVAEWEDSCTKQDGVDMCLTRGGAFNSGLSDLACAATSREALTSGHSDVGFRCCSP